MISFLFWNLNGNSPTNRSDQMRTRIGRIAVHFGIDVFVFVESKFEPSRLAGFLTSVGAGQYWYAQNDCPHIQFFHRLSKERVVDQYSSPDGRLAIQRLFVRPEEIVLASLHAPSQLCHTRSEIKDAMTDYRNYIDQVEETLKTRRTIVIGDMNLNPFDDGLVSSQAFHAVMFKERARRERRQVRGVERRYFYNPMWGLFGDRTAGPPGTYHYSKSSSIVYYWNMFDQLLLRPQLMDDLHDVRILEQDGVESLLDSKGRPNRLTASDHLPVFFRLRLDAKE
jgi:hypothetical protein